MKKEDLKVSFDKAEPDRVAEKRMLNNILSHSGREKKMAFNFRKAIPALGLVIVMAGGILTYDIMAGRNKTQSPGFINHNDDIREDAIAPLVNQFEIDGRHYILLSEDLRDEYGFYQHINESDIGERITTISKSVDPSLIGGEVYFYKPAGSEAVVVVKKDDTLWRFRFFNFESYNNNQDEDAIEYLKIYGINKADDIAKVQFIVYSDQSKIEGKLDIRGEITGKGELSRFYDYYSVIKNSSDKYFDRLFNYMPSSGSKSGAKVDAPDQIDPVAPVAPDQNPVQPVDPDSVVTAPDYNGYAEDLPAANSSMGETAPSQGSAGNALADSVSIRIYNKSGVYMETVYYRNIGFISRHEVNEDFARFLAECIR